MRTLIISCMFSSVQIMTPTLAHVRTHTQLHNSLRWGFSLHQTSFHCLIIIYFRFSNGSTNHLFHCRPDSDCPESAHVFALCSLFSLCTSVSCPCWLWGCEKGVDSLRCIIDLFFDTKTFSPLGTPRCSVSLVFPLLVLWIPKCIIELKITQQRLSSRLVYITNTYTKQDLNHCGIYNDQACGPFVICCFVCFFS